MHLLTPLLIDARPTLFFVRKCCTTGTGAATIKALTWILAISQIVGCGGGSAAAHSSRLPVVDEDKTRSSSSFVTALAGDSSGITARETVVVRNAGEWEAFWGRHASFMVPPPPPPPQDFSGRQMVGVFVGSRPDGCYGIAVTSVMLESQHVVIRYHERREAGAFSCTQAVTQPHHIIWIPSSSLPVEFRAE
jgi:hypothetical protein